jgi:MFS family permease
MLTFIAMAARSALGGWISDMVLRRLGRRAGRCVFVSIATPAIAEKFGWTASFLVAVALCGCGGLAWLLVLRKAKTAN